jgi:F0F1-type ATP synthase membrane subunit c/vacuolar-type H+-ATPase subunit K
MPDPSPDARRTTLVVWAAQLGGSLFFFAVAAFLRLGGQGPAAQPPELLDWLALALAVVLVAASFTVPGLVRPATAASPEAVARTRLIVGWALREAAALLGTVVWLLSGDAKPLAGFAIGIAALAASIPTGDRWRGAVEAAGTTPGRPPTVR